MSSIAFVILTWNSERYIDNCLRSIFALEQYDRQIYLVDNGSTDQTVPIINRWMADPEPTVGIHLIQNTVNIGTTRSRNAALKQISPAAGYVCILDSDTEINGLAIDLLVRELEGHPEYGIVGPQLYSEDKRVQQSGRNIPTLPEKLLKGLPIKPLQRVGERLAAPAAAPETSPYKVGYLMSACWLMRRGLLDEVGLLDEHIFYAPEDAEYCIRVWKSGYQVVCCPQAKIKHAWQHVSKKKLISRLNWEHIKGLVYMFSKHHCWFTSKHIVGRKREHLYAADQRGGACI